MISFYRVIAATYLFSLRNSNIFDRMNPAAHLVPIHEFAIDSNDDALYDYIQVEFNRSTYSGSGRAMNPQTAISIIIGGGIIRPIHISGLIGV
jgi:hypothetical protein